MTNVKTLKFLFALAALTTLVPGANADLVMVVHDSNSVSDLSMKELKRIYQGKITDYKNGQEITLAEHTPVNEDFYQAALGMSTRKTRRYWMKLIFSGGHATPPQVFKKIERVRQFIRETEGGICFIEASDVEEGMKILSIEGKKQGDEGYPLVTSLPTELSDLPPEDK